MPRTRVAVAVLLGGASLAGCGGEDGRTVDVRLEAGVPVDTPSRITYTVNGEETTVEQDGGDSMEVTLEEGDFDLAVEIERLDGDRDVRCAITGLEMERDVEVNPDLGIGESVQLGEAIQSGDGTHVRCVAQGTLGADTLEYGGGGEVLEGG